MSKLKKKNTQATTFNVTPEEYKAELAAGIPADEALKPGKHPVTRGGRRKITAEDISPANIKVSISLRVDLDILNEFKRRAELPNAAPYQTQMVKALRAYLEQTPSDPKEVLINDKAFIAAIAKKVREAIRK